MQKTVGFVPKFFKTLANAPAALAGYLRLSQALAKGSLSAVEREYIALAVSESNGCDYCPAAHTFCEKTGLTPEEIRRARKGSLNALTVLARQLAQGRGHLNDEQIAVARAAGFSDTKLIAVAAEVGVMTQSNYVNNIAVTDIDFPPAAR
ncbi:TPA: carboxymuconolactone decarboxylase family protein [Pseudomonas aeruginosa]|nr:carboxymuconolactone decarboxylase family protein [Pseudomonas aeruginosa]